MSNPESMASPTIIEVEPQEASDDEEKAFLQHDESPSPGPARPAGLSTRFWFSAAVNTSSTAAIIFVNKRIFENETFRHAQVTFAAFHFAVTAALLYIISRPPVSLFKAKRVPAVQILPLAFAMIFNVVLPNASLAYSSIQFYQVVRVLLTPCVALLNYVLSRETIPMLAACTLVPVCAGVAIVSYFDTVAKADVQTRGTSPVGVIFAFAGVFASSIYTVWIARYHKLLELTSMQLLFNQAPISVLLMLYIIPFSDDVTVWKATSLPTWFLILLSGILACFINLSQFVIINEAGPVSSTVVGHLKTCSIIGIGWLYSGKPFKDGSLIGIALAVGGIVSYSVVMQKYRRRK